MILFLAGLRLEEGGVHATPLEQGHVRLILHGAWIRLEHHKANFAAVHVIFLWSALVRSLAIFYTWDILPVWWPFPYRCQSRNLRLCVSPLAQDKSRRCRPSSNKSHPWACRHRRFSARRSQNAQKQLHVRVNAERSHNREQNEPILIITGGVWAQWINSK